MGYYDMVQAENSLAYIRVSQDLWMVKIPHGSWVRVGEGHAFWNQINVFPWGHWRKENLHLMQ